MYHIKNALRQVPGKEIHPMKKWLIPILMVVLCLTLCSCKGNDSIVEELEGPEGIEQFASLRYCAEQDLWLEIYYDGTWCTFEDGGMLRSNGSMTIEGNVGTLTPAEGSDSFQLTSLDDTITDQFGYSYYRVTEVGIRKPLIVNELGVPDTLESNAKVEGTPDLALAETYAGFYISEDGIYGLDIYPDGTYDLQEFGLLIESGSLLALTEPAYGQTYAVGTDAENYRLVIPQEERLYFGGCGGFAPGQKAIPSDE